MKKQDLTYPEEFKEIGEEGLNPEHFNFMVKELNRLIKEFPVSRLNGQILEVSLPASAEVRVSHSLKTIPKYRLILGQTGNAVITDVKAKWTRDYITLQNNAAVAVTLNLMIIRE